tara:strand:- start:897 stop:1064 length:168 start_codon:yes stop_codon:yes gene_type:complete
MEIYEAKITIDTMFTKGKHYKTIEAVGNAWFVDDSGDNHEVTKAFLKNNFFLIEQ